MPDIDVIMPTFNSLTYLKEAIQSIRQQTLRSSRIVVVDDGSEDGTSDWLQMQDDVLSHRQENKGAGAARNKAIKLSQAPLLAFLDLTP